MEPSRQALPPGLVQDLDQRVVLHGITWRQYLSVLKMRGESAGTRLAYLQGELEFMTPSRSHERIRSLIGRLLSAWAEEEGIELNAFGSWTVRSAPDERGVEPDECYVIGERDVDAPDIAIEVIWSSWALDKLEIYRGLGVREVWLWRENAIEVHALRDGLYVRRKRSGLLPGLDLALLARYCTEGNQSRAVRDFRAALRKKR